MAADTDDAAFEEVDWEEIDGRSVGSSPLRILEAAVVLGWLGALAYDYFVLGEGDPTFAAIGWDVTGVEWLFVLTLVLGFFHAVVPLYQNPRMTAYYWRRFRRNRAAMISAVYLVLILSIGIVGPAVMSEPTLSLGNTYQPPVGFTAAPQGSEITGTWQYPFGTDHQGQDMLKLIVFGMRVSMEVGLTAMIIAVFLGTIVGTTAAHFGGYVDEALMRYVDIQQSFPSFILLLLLIYLFGGSLVLIVLLFGLLGWESIGRLVRSEALQRTEEEYVEAARSAGASRFWIIRKHLVPNVSSTVITVATLTIPAFILNEAALAFLGLSDPNVYSWGKTIAGGRDNLANAPWIATIPGFFLFFTVLGFNFLGDALNDALDPRQDT